MVLRPDVQSFISGTWSSTAVQLLQLLELSGPLPLFCMTINSTAILVTHMLSGIALFIFT
jgi:hypothetical protein